METTTRDRAEGTNKKYPDPPPFYGDRDRATFGLGSCTHDQSFGRAPACSLPSKTKLTIIKITARALHTISLRLESIPPH